MKNDKSANPARALSNEKILTYAPTVEPENIPPMYPPMHNYTQPRPAYSKAYFDALKDEDNKLREQQQQAQKTPQNDINKPTKPQSMTDKFIGYFRPKVTPFPPVGPTETPNRLTDIHADENDEESKADGYEIDDEGAEVSPIRPLNLEAEERQHVKKTKAGKTQWKAQLKEFKQDWAYDNRGSESGMVDLEVEEIANLTVPKLNAIYDRVMSERDQLAF